MPALRDKNQKFAKTEHGPRIGRKAQLDALLSDDPAAEEAPKVALGAKNLIALQGLQHPVQYQDQADACMAVYRHVLSIVGSHDKAIGVLNWMMGKGAALVLRGINAVRGETGKAPIENLTWRVIQFNLETVLTVHDRLASAFGRASTLDLGGHPLFDETYEQISHAHRALRVLADTMTDRLDLHLARLNRTPMESCRVPVMAAIRTTILAYRNIDLDDEDTQADFVLEFQANCLREIAKTHSTNLVTAVTPWFTEHVKTPEGRKFLDVLSADWADFFAKNLG